MVFYDIDDNGGIPTLGKWRIWRAFDCYFITNLKMYRKTMSDVE
jgi:hypothetical protein